MITRIKNTFSTFFRLFNLKNRQKVLWSDLKKYFVNSDLHYGIFESERYIEAKYSIDDTHSEFRVYRYFFDKETLNFVSLVFIHQDYDQDKTTDVFILSSHFNNLLKYGVVRVNPDTCTIMMEYTNSELLPFLFPGEIHSQILAHYNVSLDLIWAFNQLLIEDQDPVFIIADLQKKHDERREKVLPSNPPKNQENNTGSDS